MKRVDLVKVGDIIPHQNIVQVDTDIPKPKPDHSEVLIDIAATAINPVDWKMAVMGVFLPDDLPATLGCDIAGTVEVGPDDLKGKRVATYLPANKADSKTSRGAFVEKVVVERDVVFEIPDGMSFAEASTLPLAALTGVLLADALVGMKAGDWVLIWGASSSVGFNAVQLAKRRGWRVIAVASGKHEKVLTEDLGADAFVDYRKDDVGSKVAAIMLEAAAAKKAGDGEDDRGKLNGAMDCIGTAESFTPSANLVDRFGDEALKKQPKQTGLLVVSTVNPFVMPTPPDGVKMDQVNMVFILEDAATRKAIIESSPSIFELKTSPILSVKGDVSAETVCKALK
eukprot:CAMPEP_0119571704 /NCGR_PEP_ID=MMETSP1352-20130426/44253_1 /TAXON_ID=265584 /ORGANISM="Stauroneis constricta, Strain CCMP1120" /LENGTH=340 /DNA_ID=CAMNT_0007621387 /DNA_START=572 /DNA_END=1594 /DNA_ORIENTATION=-